jgi:hypothetical protein
MLPLLAVQADMQHRQLAPVLSACQLTQYDCSALLGQHLNCCCCCIDRTKLLGYSTQLLCYSTQMLPTCQAVCMAPCALRLLSLAHL